MIAESAQEEKRLLAHSVLRSGDKLHRQPCVRGHICGRVQDRICLCQRQLLSMTKSPDAGATLIYSCRVLVIYMLLKGFDMESMRSEAGVE